MIRGNKGAKLELIVISGFILYTLLVFLASWLFGLVLFRSATEPGKVYGYGFALYLIMEFAISIVILIYWFARTAIRSMKKMQDYEVKFNTHILEQGLDEEDVPDKVALMAEHLTQQ